MRTAFLIDGFNFYHSLASFPKRLRWFDYVKYCRHFLPSTDTADSITYFTALAFWRAQAAKRHEVFIEACKTLGINTVLGKFKEKPSTCPICKRSIMRHEEKATDVNIALQSYRIAAKQEAEQIILVTGDTDLIPAIRMIKNDFPSVRIGVVFPYDRANRELKSVADFHHTTSRGILQTFRMPDELTKANGKKITCPPEWQ